MSQDITTISSPALVAEYVRSFIYTDDTGAKRVKVAEMTTWLAEQFGYQTGANAAPATKQAEAAAIVQRLQAAVGRETWSQSPSYPQEIPSGDASQVQSRLATLNQKMSEEVMAIESGYREFLAALPTRIKALFNSQVAPTFPPGVKLLEVTRAYVETFVTDRGEESAPSPVSELVTLDQNDTATVTARPAPPNRFITKRRLYRSATGTTQSAFRLQGEYPIATVQILDEKLDEHLNEPCPTFGWLMPPAMLKGLTGMPNGIQLGYVGRTLHACEPYHPYAYPAKYDKPLAHDITGIVAVGQSAFVGTTSRPYLISGSDSSSLSEELISSAVPCVSARSMVAIGNSVFYASNEGLALYENGNVILVTEEIFDSAQWRDYQPEKMIAAEYDGRYVAFYTRMNGYRGALVFDYRTRTMCELGQSADAVFADQDGVFALRGTKIYDLFPTDGRRFVAEWFSKEFRLGRPQHFAWVHVDSNFHNGVTATNALIRIYADNVEHDTLIITSRAPVRTRPGRATNWRVEITSDARIEGVVLASTTDELKAAQ